MGMSGIELQNMQQEAEQRRREQSRRNADFFGRLCIPTIIYALLYTIFLYENTGGILVTLFAIVTGVYSLYCMQILHIEVKATHYMVQCDDDTHRHIIRLDW